VVHGMSFAGARNHCEGSVGSRQKANRHDRRGGSKIFAGRGPTPGVDDAEVWFGGRTMCLPKVSIHECRRSSPGTFLNLDAPRCDLRPIRRYNYVVEIRLTACRIILRSEIKVDSVHRIFRGIFFGYSSKVC
jgi:hypothetical protein